MKPWGCPSCSNRDGKGDTKVLVLLAPPPPPVPPSGPPKCSRTPPGIARNSFIYTRTNIGNILQNTQLKTISRARERASDGQKRNRGRAGVGGGQQRGGNMTTPAQSKMASLLGGRHPSPPPQKVVSF